MIAHCPWMLFLPKGFGVPGQKTRADARRFFLDRGEMGQKQGWMVYDADFLTGDYSKRGGYVGTQ